MIIIDTCVLTRQSWNSPVWEVLFALRESRTLAVAIPEMVLFELLSQREREYATAVESARQAHNALWALQMSEDDGSARWLAIASPAAHSRAWEELYRRNLEVLPLTLAAAKEGLRREAYRILPARPSGKTATGGRDAAIWSTVMEQAKASDGTPVYFVSSNRNDFGTDGLFPALAAEVAAAGVSVEYLYDLDQVIAQFSQRVALPDDDPRLSERVNDVTTQAWLLQYLVDQPGVRGFPGHAVDFDDHEAPFGDWTDYLAWLSDPHVQVLEWGNAAEYTMGPTSVPAATVQVLVVGLARRDDFMQREELAAFTVDVRMLFGTTSLTALSVSAPHQITEEQTPVALDVAARVMDLARSNG